MATNKRLRTPLIKPRQQGGSFYTFGSSIEDIGLNINEKSNRVELTHYALLDIPSFSKDTLMVNGTYNNINAGDLMFAESLQNYALNLETIIRNKDDYNFAINKTCSEKVFWKWLFKIAGKTSDDLQQIEGTDYYIETNPIVKGFGQISAGSQRADDFGIYNETFVQIPSSYGQMVCLFKKDPDDNFNTLTPTYQASELIENISSEEIDIDNNIITTSINASSIVDDKNTSSYIIDDMSMLSLELDINKLKLYYNNNTLTYDDLGFGATVNSSANREGSPSSYNFNAILVYYSIFDANGNDALATNLYGIYIIDKAMDNDSDALNSYKLPSLEKKRTTSSEAGTSFSFRLNIKTTSAYSGDIEVIDNSTSTFSMSTDFNDVLRNLDTAIRALSSNTKLMYDITQSNKNIQQLAAQALDKVNDLEHTINNIKNGDNKNEMILLKSPSTTNNTYNFNKSTAQEILDIAEIGFDFKRGNASIKFPKNKISNLSENAQTICKSLMSEVSNTTYFDTFKLLALIIAASK